MKKIKISLLGIGLLGISLLSIWISNAQDFLTLGEFLTIYWYGISQNIDNNWEWMKLKFDWLKKDSDIYKAIQKAVYMGYLPDMNVELPLSTYLTKNQTIKLLKVYNEWFSGYQNEEMVDTKWTIKLIESISNNIEKKQKEIESKIFQDIQNKLKENYIYQDKLDQSNKNNSIKDYIQDLKDDYTVFFPKNNAKEFTDSVNGKFEWIWAYIDELEPWKIIIESPIKWSPAEKSWLKAWDIILQVDNNIVNSGTSLSALINRVKWPAETYVKILIKRWNNDLSFKIKRWKIVVPNVEYKILEWNNCYMLINQFNQQSRMEFWEGIDFFGENSCDKYIFDVRNNPWWVLEDVWYMVNHFVPNEEIWISIKYKDKIVNMVANDETKKLFDKNIIVLINEWTASASEIFTLSIRDYVKNNIILWIKSFGKWSVQNLTEYSDWSILKYTVAKRYSGKSQTNIDKVWIIPDYKILDNVNTKEDELLEVAKMYKFK